MKRANLAVGALGAGLLLLAGCSALGVDFDLGLAGASAAGNVRVIDGSPETVAVTLQDSLKKRGLEATLLKDLINWNPVDPGRFHGDGFDAALLAPLGRCSKFGGEGSKAPNRL